MTTGCTYETMWLVGMTVCQAAEGTIRALITQIVPDLEKRYQRTVHDKLGLITRHAPSSTQARRASRASSRGQPRLGDSRESRSSSAGYIRTRNGPAAGLDRPPQDLAESLAADPAADAANLLAVAARNMPLHRVPYEWARAIGAVRQATRLSGRAGSLLLEVHSRSAWEPVPEVTRALSSCDLISLKRSPDPPRDRLSPERQNQATARAPVGHRHRLTVSTSLPACHSRVVAGYMRRTRVGPAAWPSLSLRRTQQRDACRPGTH